jgi:hypothetical protein
LRKIDGRDIGFVESGEFSEFFGISSDADKHQSRRKGIQRAGVSDFDFFACVFLFVFEKIFELVDSSKTCYSMWFVDDEEHINALKNKYAHRHCEEHSDEVI